MSDKFGECILQKNRHDTVSGSERRPFIFIFRSNIGLHNLCQVDENVIETEKSKQKLYQNLIKPVGYII